MDPAGALSGQAEQAGGGKPCRLARSSLAWEGLRRALARRGTGPATTCLAAARRMGPDPSLAQGCRRATLLLSSQLFL